MRLYLLGNFSVFFLLSPLLKKKCDWSVLRGHIATLKPTIIRVTINLSLLQSLFG